MDQRNAAQIDSFNSLDDQGKSLSDEEQDVLQNRATYLNRIKEIENYFKINNISYLLKY